MSTHAKENGYYLWVRFLVLENNDQKHFNYRLGYGLNAL